MVEVISSLTSAVLWASYGYWMRGQSGINYIWLLVGVVAGGIAYQFAKKVLLS